jgi:adenine-specific DNA glycosylase
MVWPLAMVRRRGHILLRRRGRRGLLSQLWDLPGGQCTGRKVVPLLRTHLAELKIPHIRAMHIGEIRHTITRWRIRSPVYLFDIDGDTRIDLVRARWRWVSPAKLTDQATSAMTAKAAALLCRYENPV